MQNFFDGLTPNERNRTDRIRLRKALGKNICNVSTETLSAFYSNVLCPQKYEEKIFPIACLYCEQGKNGTLELPTAWALYSSNDRKIAKIVDSPWDDNVARSLIRIARQLMSKGYSIDLEKLARDVIFWNSDITRKEWARKISEGKENK